MLERKRFGSLIGILRKEIRNPMYRLSKSKLERKTRIQKNEKRLYMYQIKLCMAKFNIDVKRSFLFGSFIFL